MDKSRNSIHLPECQSRGGRATFPVFVAIIARLDVHWSEWSDAGVASRAALCGAHGQGISHGHALSDYSFEEFREIAERPTIGEFRQGSTRKVVVAALKMADLLCEERAAR